jgi:hypothetical protein
MSVGTNSYGSAAGVGALVPRYAGSTGGFDTTTRPTLAQVEALIDQVSSLINMILSKEGFAIPVVQADAKLALTIFSQEEVAAICEGINGSGRFGPTTKSPGKSRFSLITDDIQDFIESNSIGFEALGASRPVSTAGSIGFRDTDESGHPTFPIFQRDAFGKDSFFKDWDIPNG